MKFSTPTLSALTIGLLLPIGAFATPTIFPAPKSLNNLLQIKNETTSNVLSDDTSETLFYVMPPNSGKGTASPAQTVSALNIECERIPIYEREVNDLETNLDDLAKPDNGSQKEISSFDQKIANAEDDFNNYKESNDGQALASIDDQIQSNQSEIDADRTSLTDCYQDRCDYLRSELDNLNRERTTLMNDRKVYVAKNPRIAHLYNQKKLQLNFLQQRKQELLANLERLKKSISEDRSRAEGMLNEMNQRYGARVSLTFEADWAGNLAALQAANPKFQFVQVSATETTLYPQVKIVGATQDPIIGMDLVGPEPSENRNGVYLGGFPTKFQTSVSLSLLGSCPLVRPDLFPAYLGTDSSKKVQFSFISTFQFPAAMKLEMKAKYNLRSLVTRTVELHKKGGFFSSKSRSTTDIRGAFQGIFSIDWSSQDPQNEINDAERLSKEEDVRNDLLERAVTQAMGSVQGKLELADLPATNPHGAAVLGESVMKVCPLNAWCQASAGLLTTLDAIFGRSDSASSLSMISNIEAEESWSSTKIVQKPWVTSYTF